MDGIQFHLGVNWVSLLIFVIVSAVVGLHARRVAGSWVQPWIGLKPVWWVLLLLFVPFIGLPVLIVQLIAHRRTPTAITGSDHQQ